MGLTCNFGREHFGAAALGDRRRTERLVKAADAIMAHPGGALPEKLGGWSELIGLYRLAARPEVTHAAALEPHRQRTLELMRREPVALVVHDTTELDYTSRRTLAAELGQIGNGRRRGYLCHNSLALTPDRRALGLASQTLHLRRCVPAGETPAQKRDHQERESRLWLKGVEAVGPGPTAGPTAGLWVDVCDRGADSFEFAAYEVRHGRHFVIRAARDRTLGGEEHLGCDRIHRKLFAYARDLPDLGVREVAVAAQAAKAGCSKARTARVRIAAGPVTVAAPHFCRGRTAGEASLNLWVIHVKELYPPAGVQPLEWALLSDLPADTFAGACQKVDWYECRPVVEELHKAMKSGCAVEGLQFEDPARLAPLIALLSVVATALLALRQLARAKDADLTPASAVAPQPWVRVLSGWRYKEQRELSVLEFCLALAKLGGHLNRKNDGPPGWLTLWRGWQKLHAMLLGAEAISRQRCV